jgi:hypothetical protein
MWWSVAVDSGFDAAVADSVATTLPATPTAREQWMSDAAYRSARVLPSFLERVRARLHVRAQPDSALATRLTLHLASRVATVRWPPDGGNELGIRNDVYIRAALNKFPQLPTILGTPAH